MRTTGLHGSVDADPANAVRCRGRDTFPSVIVVGDEPRRARSGAICRSAMNSVSTVCSFSRSPRHNSQNYAWSSRLGQEGDPAMAVVCSGRPAFDGVFLRVGSADTRDVGVGRLLEFEAPRGYIRWGQR
jgi:hypothetical protein